MEHPLHVEEHFPLETPLCGDAGEVEFAAAPLSTADTVTLPNLPASDVRFLRPSDPQYAAFLPAANKRSQLSPALRAVCKTRTRGRGDGPLGPDQ
jgi:hypothetical protein